MKEHTPQQPKKPSSSSPLEAAYCAAWNARWAAVDRIECMNYCAAAIHHLDDVSQYEMTSLVREKIGEAQEYWGLQ